MKWSIKIDTKLHLRLMLLQLTCLHKLTLKETVTLCLNRFLIIVLMGLRSKGTPKAPTLQRRGEVRRGQRTVASWQERRLRHLFQQGVLHHFLARN